MNVKYDFIYVCIVCVCKYVVQSLAFKLTVLRLTFLCLSIEFSLATMSFYIYMYVQYVHTLHIIHTVCKKLMHTVIMYVQYTVIHYSI
jgi:hypothetical protein